MIRPWLLRWVPRLPSPLRRALSARIVLTHSTHCDQLISALEKLANVPEIHSIVPGRLATARGNAEQLDLRVTVPVRNGYKIIARKGTQVQEVFIVTQLSAESLQNAVNSVLQLL